MKLQILGMGCTNCKKLYELTKEAMQELKIDAEIEKVEDIQKIMSYGVMRTPALVVNGKVKAFGRIPRIEEIIKYIQEEL